jgi:anaerobic magnesium-protoporphyrin IX monomethyl ester cyclase
MRVLLINSNLKDDILAAPPIGLCYVASAAEAAGHQVQVLDLCFQSHIRAMLQRAIDQFSPEVIGISLRNIDNCNMLYPVSYLPEAERLVRVIRELSSATLVLGGSGVSVMPEKVFSCLPVDYIVVSDGEESFVSLLKALQQGESPRDIPGLGMRHQGKFHLTPPRHASFPTIRPNLPKWVDLKPYRQMGSSYLIQTKRGCSHRCIYCTYSQLVEGHRFRLRDPLGVVDELEEAYYRYRPDSFEFVDSTFNDPIDYCNEILEEIVRRPWQAKFSTMGMSPMHLNDSFLELLWQSGFRSFMTTPESASATMICNYQKGFTVDDIILAAEAINRSRFKVMWYFLIGGPGENNQTLQETLDFVTKYLHREKHPPYHLANFYLGVRTYPYTRLWEIAQQEGFIPQDHNPLQQLWYLSEELDLDLAVQQLNQAACRYPEVFLGSAERFLSISKFLALLGNLFSWSQPYLHQVLWISKLLVKLRLRSRFQSWDAATRLRSYLKHQGYRGPLLEPIIVQQNSLNPREEG